MSAATRIKLCGLTREADIDLAVALGVDMIGLVFAPRSPRRLELARGAALRARIPATVRAVALVMDATKDEVAAILDQVQPDWLQFHGEEPEAFCSAFARPYLKAVALGGVAAEAAGERLRAWPSAHAILLDGHAPGEAGGSGRSLAWNALPALPGRRVLVAGGLNADNVAHAIAQARPWGVDASSGLESAPGIKDPERMRAFVTAVRQADLALDRNAPPA